MSKRMLILMCSILLVVPVVFMGCGSDGAAGPQGLQGNQGLPGQDGTNGTNGTNLTAVAEPESCAVCHGTAGAGHQTSYDALYQDNVIRVTNLAYSFDSESGADIVTFNMTKAGVALNCNATGLNLNIYFAPYDNVASKFQFSPSRDRLSIKGTLAASAGACTSTKASFDNVALSAKNGYVVVYGYDEQVGSIPSPSRVKQVKYPYAQLLKTGTVDYVSAANNAGCERCHTVPYLKHGNIYGQVGHVAATDFVTCKACHLDDRDGGHFVWQLLVDDTARAGALWAEAPGDVESLMTGAEETKYAYKTRLMNDVHMSHAMEFEYPQSMSNCVACHEGKLDRILTDANFTAETCKSCHAVTGSALSEKPQPSLQAIWAAAGVSSFHNATQACNICHAAGGVGAVFSAIHSGYDKKIYGAPGTKYSSAITVTIDNASFAGNVLTFGFSATGSLGGLSATSIQPTVMVGLYGWETKDYLYGPHESTAGVRNLEWAVGGTAHPRFTTVSAGGGRWTISANLSTWADNITSGCVKRVEIAVMPKLLNADNVIVALDAPSKTFDLAANSFVDFFSPIVKVPTGCNNCHEALATTFHSADRGGNIVVCRLCHITKSGGSHLEMQSRSIDSYVHAIHSFQAFDIADIDFADPVEKMFYDLKTESHYPTFGITNCTSCHNAGTFNVPNQARSLAGVFSASDSPLEGRTRNIGSVPSYIAGPASRACGACHRAELIKEDDVVGLASFNSHTSTNGYLLEGANILTSMSQVMSYFEDYTVPPSP